MIAKVHLLKTDPVGSWTYISERVKACVAACSQNILRSLGSVHSSYLGRDVLDSVYGSERCLVGRVQESTLHSGTRIVFIRV